MTLADKAYMSGWPQKALSLLLFISLTACQQLGYQQSAHQPQLPVARAAASNSGSPELPLATAKQPRNIILMIGDGMGPSHISALRYYLDNPATELVEPLLIDQYLVGSLRTSPHGTQGEVTDSAASATAYATGHKTINGALSVSAEGDSYPTVLEMAKKQGLATGLVSTSQINHATPAAFASHVKSRREYAEIARQMARNPTTGGPVVDVMLGGGLSYFRNKQQDLVAELVAQGYQFAQNKTQLAELAGSRLLGLFAPVGLDYAIDRPESTPSLAQMTDKALTTLSANQAGFFLMIEGSEIDWAAHGNDIVGVISEMQDFFAAIRRVQTFVKTHPDTLVLITADHATGGLSVGREIADKSFYQWKPTVLAKFSHSANWIVQQAAQYGSLLRSFQAAADIKLNRGQRALLKTADVNDVKSNALTVSQLISELTLTGWTTHGHTGVDVNLYAFGAGAELFRGHHDNTYIGQSIFRLLARP